MVVWLRLCTFVKTYHIVHKIGDFFFYCGKIYSISLPFHPLSVQFISIIYIHSVTQPSSQYISKTIYFLQKERNVLLMSSLSNNSPFVLPPGWLLLYTNYTSIKLILKTHYLHPAALPALTWDNFCSLYCIPLWLLSVCWPCVPWPLSRVSTKHPCAWFPRIIWGLYSLALIQEGVSSLSPPVHESFCLA